jgi:zinc finger protein
MDVTPIVDTEVPAVELEEKKELDYDVWDGVDEIVSLCMSCGANGMTRLMLHKIPYFRELIIASFCCDECGERNNEVSFGGEIQPQGCVYDLLVTTQKDLDRQMIKSDSASVRIPELDFEIPSSTQKGEINTIEGFLRNAAKNLAMYQDERMAQFPETGIAVALVIVGLNQMADGHKTRLPFHLILDDPAGNSYVQNPLAPLKDAAVQELHYSRSAEQDISLGLQPEKETGVFKSDADSNYKALMGGEGSRGFGEAAPAVEKPVNNDYNSAANVGGGFLSTVVSDEAVRLGRSEVVSIPSPCPHCGVEGESLTALTDIPHFKEVIIMAFNCSACGFRNNEVKAGGAVPDLGTEVTLVVKCADDLRRDVLKSDSCMVFIPELELELGCGTLGGVYTTVEGLVKKIHTSLGNSNPFAIGDSTTLNHSEDVEVQTSKGRFKTFLARLDEFGAGTVLPFTLILRDPLGNSFVSAPLGSFLPPESDHNITMVDFERSYEENEDFGLNDINTKDFETGFEGEKLAILSDRLTHVVTAGPDHPSFFAKGMDDATPGGAYVAGSAPPPAVEYIETDPSYIVVPPPGWLAAKSSSAAVEDHSAELERGVHESESETVAEDLPYEGYGKRVFDEADFALEYAPREEFAGARKGFVFRMGGQGIGYYTDVPKPAEDAAEGEA